MAFTTTNPTWGQPHRRWPLYAGRRDELLALTIDAKQLREASERHYSDDRD